MTVIAHAIVVVVGVAAMVVLAATKTIAGDVAVSGITLFVGYGVGVGVNTATTKTAA